MTARAALYYLWHKYVHETRYDNYQMDMLRVSASAYLKQPPDRYYELTEGKRHQQKSNIEYTVNDVVDMFAGTGKLA